MKNIFKIALFFISAFAISSCVFDGDDDNVAPETNSKLKVVSSEVLFDAAPASGKIVVEAPGEITAESESEWCSVSVNGSTVNVSVSENGSLNGRSSLITIKSRNEKTTVICQQKGLRFELSAGSQIKTNSDKAQQFTYDLKTNVNLNFRSDDDWYTYEVDGEKLKVNLTENTTGHIRIGYLYYESETYKDSIKVVQYDLKKDIQGNAYLIYMNNSGQQDYETLTITETDLVFSDYYPIYDWKIPYTFDEENLQFVIKNGSRVGTYSSYFLYTIIGGGGYLSTSTSVTYNGPIEYNSENGYLVAPFSSTWTYGLEKFSFYAMTADSPTASRAGTLLVFGSPMIVRYDEDN